MSLKRKVALFYTFSVLGILLFFSIAVGLLLRRLEERSLEVKLLNLAEREEDVLERLERNRWESELSNIPCDVVQLFEANGKIRLVFSKPNNFPPLVYGLVEKLISSKTGLELLISEEEVDGEPYRLVAIRVVESSPVNVLLVGCSLRPVEQTLKLYTFIVLAFLPLISVISYMLSFLLVRASLAPVVELTKIAKTISAENLSRRISVPDTKDEIEELARTFNYMIERLETSVSAMKSFAGEVAHQLKTPLTALKAYAELSKDETFVEKIDELIHLVDGLLCLAKLEGHFNTETFSLDVLVLEVLEEVMDRCDSQRVDIKLDRLDCVRIEGNRSLVKHAVYNVVDNAVKYTKEGTVVLSLTKTERRAVLSVADTGPGFDTSKTSYGFGLSLVEKVLRKHEAVLEIESVPGKGTMVRMIFKLAE